MKQIINTPDAPAPIGPYNQAVKVGDTLYVSGQIPMDPKTSKLVTTGIADETEMVMQNLEAILKAAGLTFDHVVKCTIFIMDMNDFSTINEVYGQRFGNDAPARETVQVSRLPKDVNVEISCIAVS